MIALIKKKQKSLSFQFYFLSATYTFQIIQDMKFEPRQKGVNLLLELNIFYMKFYIM